MTLALVLLFAILLIAGFPVVFALAISAFGAVLIEGKYPVIVVVKEMFTGLDSFPLMAVPFFVLAAELMTGGAMTAVLLRFAAQFFGRARGGLGYANVLSSTLFAGISGSALADAAGPGGMMMKMMEKEGYPRSYAAALTASAAVVGPIIPPSITMIIYAMQDERVSVGGLFMAGILPGILIALIYAGVNMIQSFRHGYRSETPVPPLPQILRNTVHAIPALLLIVVVIGGIRGGIFTPTEASVMAVFYALFCGMFLYRTLRLRAIPEILLASAVTSGAILMILAAARAFAWVLVIERIPQDAAQYIVDMNLSPIAFLLVVNVALLIFGCFMDPLPGVMILVPILAPIAHSMGIDPTHFAILVIVNLTMGLVTPPVGSLLFVVSSVGRVPVAQILKEMPIFMAANLLILIMLSFLPAITTFLPRLSGF
ncbi:TRAP transporter large permease [Cereibacter changlensis JA139]|uniref:TRAP transporter large permease protein n=2 Tax=Cereibacter changlensis TaxID=402884 RepID=A0A2T4JVJ9_9RHOB|nr:TRAP transporter large permease [Cereibacter changlensis]PTE21837.1 TRAP transporter large permease [Cereibacter changlensis JA139]PZX48478.1 tripartite ATP-independent transporter DctM subunit [Cereibacter changlensis]